MPIVTLDRILRCFAKIEEANDDDDDDELDDADADANPNAGADGGVEAFFLEKKENRFLSLLMLDFDMAAGKGGDT